MRAGADRMSAEQDVNLELSQKTALVEDLERRSEVRYDVQHPCNLYFVFPNGDVDLSSSVSGVIWDISRNGLSLITNGIALKRGQSFLLEVKSGSEGQSKFQNLTVISISEGQEHRANCVFGGPLGFVFDHEVLMPTLQNDMKFAFSCDTATLATLANSRVITPKLLDHVEVCPKCSGIPTVRKGCARCLSSHVESSRMIHHFACAHVDFEETFDAEGTIVCRKCRAKNLIVGADFEYLEGPKRCQDCHQANLEKIDIGHCLNCGHRFPFSLAKTQEILGYHVSKLDLLVLLDTN